MKNSKFLIRCFITSVIAWEGIARKTENFSTNDPFRFKRSISEDETGEEQPDDYYADSQENNDNCTRLLPNLERSHVSYEHNISFTSLIDGGFNEMVNNGKYKDVILIMGNTGVGKTVLTQIIAGDLTSVHAVKTSTGNLVIVDDFERISAPSIISRTLIPELVVKTENGSEVAFYDCPGFDDTRGPAQDVAASFFVNQIIKKVNRVKMLFLILQSSVTLGHDRSDFDLMAEHATNFVKNITKFKDSIGLVVTKVNNYNGLTYMRDGSIKIKIVEFLQMYNETMCERLKEYLDRNDTIALEKVEKTRRKIEFLNILLEKDSNNRYSRIGFSRDPEKCGQLSESTEVANTKKRIEKLYKSLSYSEVGNHEDNFGFSLKPHTVLQINGNYVPEINIEIVNKIEHVVNSFKSWLTEDMQKEIIQCSASLNENFVRLSDYSKITIEDLLAQNYGNNFTINLVTFSKVLKSGFYQIGFMVPGSFVEFMTKQDNILDFLEKLVGSDSNVRRISDWIVPLSSLRDAIVSVYIPEINNKIAEKARKLVGDFQNWLDTVKFEGFESVLTSNIINRVLSPYIFWISLEDNMLSNIFIKTASQFGRSLKYGFKQVGYPVPIMLEKYMERQDEFFQFFQKIVGSERNFVKLDEWINPLSSFCNNITKIYIPETNYRIVEKITQLALFFENWFDSVKIDSISKYSTSTAGNLNEMVELAGIHLNKMMTLNNNNRLSNSEITTIKLSQELQIGFNQIGFVVPESFVKFMKTQDMLFKIFQKIVGPELPLMKINDWINTLFPLQAKIVEYKSWYSFCTNLQTTLISHRFHENKVDLTWYGTQRSLETIERNLIISVPQNIKALGNKYSSSSKQMQLLDYMLLYSMTSVNISCTGTTITVKGHFVRLGDFVDGNGNVRQNISYCFRRNLKRNLIEVYASNTIFIDESLNGKGSELKLVLVSPKWKVIGRPHINLNGFDGIHIFPQKAQNGLYAGDVGSQGLAGRPGGPGGVFVGIVGKIENGNKLKVTCDGGNGGNGQDGGNGRNGNDGKAPQNKDTHFDDEINALVWYEYWRKFAGHPGHPGGNGGDGGVGGVGGLPGKIYLRSVLDQSSLEVQVSQLSGNIGNFGWGGEGGEGGKPGRALICHEGNIIGIWKVDKYKCRQEDSSLPQAPNGSSGLDNYSRLGFSQPSEQIHEINQQECVSTFKEMFLRIVDFDCKKFVDTL